MRIRDTACNPVVPDDPALLPVLVCEETPELSVENIAAHVCDRHNVALLEKLALRKQKIK